MSYWRTRGQGGRESEAGEVGGEMRAVNKRERWNREENRCGREGEGVEEGEQIKRIKERRYNQTGVRDGQVKKCTDRYSMRKVS